MRLFSALVCNIYALITDKADIWIHFLLVSSITIPLILDLHPFNHQKFALFLCVVIFFFLSLSSTLDFILFVSLLSLYMLRVKGTPHKESLPFSASAPLCDTFIHIHSKLKWVAKWFIFRIFVKQLRPKLFHLFAGNSAKLSHKN